MRSSRIANATLLANTESETAEFHIAYIMVAHGMHVTVFAARCVQAMEIRQIIITYG